jgi:carbon-monoxide dehydrogenase iron sulfur subunit
MGKIIVIDIKECMACRTCEIECSLAHSKTKTLEEAMNEVEPRVNVEGAEEFAVPVQCRHCEMAPCIKICPTHAISREDPDSPVIINQDRCIGCNFCLAVCPFGAISPSYDGHRVIKCDLCFERLEAGQEPACVASCPTGALKFVEAEIYVQGKRVSVAEELVSSIQQEKQKEEQKENTQ